MITINEYRNVLAYYKGNIEFKELTKKEQKYAKKQINNYLRITKKIEELRKLFQIQNEYEEKKGE